jgi:hypothetical protein
MISLKTEAILRGIVVFAEMRRKWTMERAGRQPFEAHQFQFALQCSKELASALDDSGLAIAAGHASGLAKALEAATVQTDGTRVIEGKSFSNATHHLDRLISVIAEEAGTKFFLSLPPSAALTYESTSPLLGERVETAFIDATYDINEAGNCLALERSTATVFHLMRAMEIGVRILGQNLNATIANERGETLPWGIIVANVKQKIEALPKGPKQDEWLKVHSLLHSVNRAFRTKTAHPAQKYTQEEAQNAFNVTKAFMQEMASMILP